MIKLIPILFSFLFIITILWCIWKVTISINPSLRRTIEKIFGNDLDETKEEIDYRISREEEQNAIIKSIRRHKKNKLVTQDDLNEIKDFLK